MWLQFISLVTAFSAAHGMCFGVPLLQQTMACPEPMVYYPQLCICMEPGHIDRFHQVGAAREVPMLTNSYMDPSHTFKNKLDAIRYRMTASLPDTGSHGHGSSLGDIRVPLFIIPDGHYTPRSQLSTMQNYVPKTWRIGGLLEAWSRDALPAGHVPALNSGGVYSPTMSGWSTGIEDLSTLSLMERLHALRSQWREASQSQAQRGLGDLALAQEFFKHLPITGISPDTARSYFHLEAGVPDTSSQPGTYNDKLPKETVKTPLVSLKDAEMMKKEISDILPKDTSGRTNSFLRSALRLQAATRN